MHSTVDGTADELIAKKGRAFRSGLEADAPAMGLRFDLAPL
jgi:hypothetical protein